MSSEGELAALRAEFGGLDGAPLIAGLAARFPGQMAVISSFGAEAAVLLDLVAQVDRALPVVFLDTDALFDETLEYRHRLVDQLGLTGVRTIHPEPADLREADELWRANPDRCCHLRKVLPLERAVRGYRVLIDGRKRFHGAERAGMSVIEMGEGGVIKASPLAPWSRGRIEAAFGERGLPRHPLAEMGYSSIGCWPCTRPTAPGEAVRAGRWAGSAKTECGIHL